MVEGHFEDWWSVGGGRGWWSWVVVVVVVVVWSEVGWRRWLMSTLGRA